MYYKYKSDSQYTEMIFRTGKVHLSTAQALNDPFECSLQEIGKEWIDEQVKQMKLSAVAGFILLANKAVNLKEPFFGLSAKETSKILEEISKEKNINTAYEIYKNFMIKANDNPPADCENFFSNIDIQLNEVGIFSMSTSPLIQLLWAHYTDDHKGICIGFSANEGSKLQDPKHCLQVIYSDSIPKMSREGFKSTMSISIGESGKAYTSAFKIAFSDKIFQSAISTKPTCWSYEKEWRYVEPHGGEYIWPGKITELIFGLQCPEKRREHYLNLVSRNVPNEVYLYEIVKKGAPKNWNEFLIKSKKPLH